MSKHRRKREKRFFALVFTAGLLICGLLVTGAFLSSSQPVSVIQMAVSAPVTHRVTLKPAKKAHEPAEAHRKPSLRRYAIRTGDTLWSVAAEYCGSGKDYPELAAANRIADPDAISAGQVLVLAC
jgi:nucleoid-associated protein YgaU